MPEQNLILKYRAVGLPIINGTEIKLYEDGKVEVIGVGTDFESGKSVDGKKLGDIRIPQEQVFSYADRLAKAGFFDFKNEYPGLAFDGLLESMTLNYKGKSKTVSCQNEHPPSQEFDKIISELEALVK